jgi:hypothetical protein
MEVACSGKATFLFSKEATEHNLLLIANTTRRKVVMLKPVFFVLFFVFVC